MVLDGVICPPKDDEPSCDLYKREKCCILNALAERAAQVHVKLNAIDGISCTPVKGALYAYPRVLYN